MNTRNEPAPVEHLGAGVYRIDTKMQRPGLDACYLIGAGQHWALVDTGPATCVETLRAALDSLGVAAATLRLICPTHVHLDHAGGVGSLLPHFPNAEVLAHARALPHLVDPAKINAGARAVYGEPELLRLFGYLQPVPSDRIRAVSDGETVSLGRRELKFIDTPGHARHHYCVWDAASRGFFAGDSFGLSYREFDNDNGAFILPTTTPVQFEPESWHRTLTRFLEHEPEQMYLTHFGRVGQVEKLAGKLQRYIDDYCGIAHRHADAGADRHAQLVQALTEHALQSLAVHGCDLPEAEQRKLLAMDMELNAQGLGVWLDRQARRA